MGSDILAKVNIRDETIIDSKEDLEKIINNVTYDNSILNQLRFKFGIESHYNKEGEEIGWEIYCEFYRPDIVTGQMGWGRGRNEIIKKGAYEGSAVKTMYLLIELLLKHEAMEGFRYCGIQVFNPHHTLPELSLPHLIRRAQINLPQGNQRFEQQKLEERGANTDPVSVGRKM